MNDNTTKQFWVSNATAGYGTRIFLKEDAPWCDHTFLKEMSVWKGYDKSYGPWRGYEVSQDRFHKILSTIKHWGYCEIPHTNKLVQMHL